MRTTQFRRSFYGVLFVAISLLPMRSEAVLPVAMMGTEILKNIILGEAKDQMFGSLSNMGCKGSRLAGILATVDTSKSFNAGMIPPGMSMGMPSGLPSEMPGGMGGNASNGGMGMPGMAMPNGAASMPGKGAGGSTFGHSGMPTMTPEQAQAMMANGMPDMSMISQMSGMSPDMSPDQMQQMQQAMAGIQQAMSHPLSRKESLAVFDEMGNLGLMTKDQLSEVHDCIELAPTGSDASIGMAGAMFKNMLLPMLKDAKLKLSNLTPEEQTQLTDGMVDALNHASAKDRQAFLDGYGAGFYPAQVVERVRAKLGTK